MNTDKNFIESEYTIEDLEQFRDEKGFIDLTKAGIILDEESREIRGNANRIKNWVKFNEKKALIKGEITLEEEANYGIYAELIVEEIAKARGIEAAHYDLIKLIDEDGKEILGVLSESVADIDKGEELVSLHSMIGDEPLNEDLPDVTGYEFVIDKLTDRLFSEGYSKEQIELILTGVKQRLNFGLETINTDQHTENIAFIKQIIDGKKTIRLSPVFDNEASLMLDNDKTTINKLLQDYNALKESLDIADPKIGILISEEDGGHQLLWKDTLEELINDDDMYDYCAETLEEPVDMEEILNRVEQRIKAKLPEDVRLIAKYSYQLRNEEMIKIIEGDSLEQDALYLLDTLLDKVRAEEIRTGEQIEIGHIMEKDMATRITDKTYDNTDEKGEEIE